uniref:Mediator of RNA polymerase II transcription subunit 28 n=1 Tax=Salarias fasciatus TaxID=181472 RepID=A0A672H021_SALFA
MASSMGGMFPGQQPPGPHPVGGPSGPGQPGFPGSAPRAPGNNTLVDELEASFEACFASLVSQDYVNGTDQEEIRTGVDQCIQKFLDVARQTECFFLQKRLQLSVQKPEQVVKEVLSLHSPLCVFKNHLCSPNHLHEQHELLNAYLFHCICCCGLFLLKYAFFSHFRMCQSCVMSSKGRNCWFRST